MQTHSYLISGQIIHSEIPLPESVSISPGLQNPDIVIRKAKDSLQPSPSYQEKLWYDAKYSIQENKCLLEVPNVASYLIKNGKAIYIESKPDATTEVIRVFLLGTVFSILLLQRGLFLLHASVVDIHGMAVGFLGDSGAGKSTMAAWFSKMGYSVLCDDTCLVTFENDHPIANASFPRIKLWEDALDPLQLSKQNLTPDSSREKKYHITTNGAAISPKPLAGLFLLDFSPENTLPYITNMQNTEAVNLLRKQTYRNEFISDMGLTREHFNYCVELTKTIDIKTLTRSRNHKEIELCVNLVEEYIESIEMRA